jgi:uncharacterized membrane protein YgdD (TMEM256/DUF423 family)
MKNITLIIGALYGMTAVILGALGSHAFKKILSIEKLQSFEIGIKYQMYHALLLLILGFFLKMETCIEKTAAWFIIFGTFLFSVSIYFLSFQEVLGRNLKFLGPITPLGGVLMISGWALLVYYFTKFKVM